VADNQDKNKKSAPGKKPQQAAPVGPVGKDSSQSKKPDAAASLLPTAQPAASFLDSMTRISDQRAAIDGLSGQIGSNATQLTRLEAQRRMVERTGGTVTQLGQLDTQLATLREQHKSLLDQQRQASEALAGVRNQVVADTSPEQLVGTLDGGVPILLMPVRLETRFFKNGTEVHIRIFVDQAHVDGHEPELTDSEIRAGQWYWKERWNTGQNAPHAWRALVNALGARRAGWVVRALIPQNLDKLGSSTAPVFPSPTAKASAWTRAVQATGLPDRWVAIGYQGDIEVFRKWGAVVPDTLPVSLTPDPAGVTPPPEENEMALDDGMLWTVDYDRALALGMAITVSNAELTAGHILQNGLTKLVVVGVDWTLNPEQSASAIASLISDHQYSDGFEFIKQGTPTNNTGMTRSALNETDEALAERYDPALPPPKGVQNDASHLFIRALGLDPAKTSLDRVPGGALQEQRTASSLLNVLWRGTLGYYLDELLNMDGDGEDSDPLLSDELWDLARRHVTSFLFPGGPFSAFRIGKQPYGLLPVVAPGFQPSPKDSFSGRLLWLLNKLRPFWVRGLNAVPRVSDASSSAELDDILLRILQNTPLAATAQFRRVIGSATAANTLGLRQYEQIQADIFVQLLSPHFGWNKPPRLTEFITDPRSYNLPVPWVQASGVSETSPLQPNYFTDTSNIMRGTQGNDARAVLTAQEDADTLLQALLALAAVEEIDHSANELVQLHHKNLGRAQPVARQAGVRITEMLYTEQLAARSRTTTVQTANIYSRAELAQVILPTVTKDVTLASFITQAMMSGGQSLRQPELANLSGFLSDLRFLATVPSAEIERTFKGVLDGYSHRLDAWYTSLATRRLFEIRTKRQTGVYIGGYGWVENLHLESQPDSLGYIHAPSIPQAITAAILRSAHLSHQTGEVPNDQTPFSIDLSSKRVRLALDVINGVARGQPLAALLGYRFERNLRERNINLARFILPFRQLTPLRPNEDVVAPGQSVESIAARDVVDAVALLEKWRAERFNLFKEKLLTDQTPTGDEINQIGSLLDELEETNDAASDVLMAESVYQTLLGNYERANAATAALDRQERPVSPDVVRTPRTGKSYAQRVMVLFGNGGLLPAWTTCQDSRSRAEPRVNAWIGSLLGSPKRIQIAARLLKERSDGKPPDEVKRLALSIDSLKMSPISLVFAAAPGGQQRPSDLEERLVMQFASLVPNGDPSMIIELLDTLPDKAAAGSIGLGDLRVMLDWLRAFVSERRAADARDLALAEDLPVHGVDSAELVTRVNLLKTDLSQTVAALKAAKQAPALRTALQRAAAIGTPNSMPRTTLNDAAATAQLKTQAQDAQIYLETVQAAISQADADIAGKTLGIFEQAQHQISLIKIVFGKSFPVLPTFLVDNAAELKSTLADQAALTNKDALAASGWLRTIAQVRPGAESLSSVLSAAALLGSPAAGGSSFSLMQLPHRPGQRWQALPFTDGAVPTGDLAIFAHMHAKPDVTKALAGFVCDEWVEVIPNAVETTAISFHYDAPGARPPHLMILAVPPNPAMQNWSFQTLLDTVNETFTLGQLRAVGPKEMQVLAGNMLPAVYLPNNFTKDVPTIDLFKLRASYLGNVIATGVLGKEILKGN
jgi:hypothetical protein